MAGEVLALSWTSVLYLLLFFISLLMLKRRISSLAQRRFFSSTIKVAPIVSPQWLNENLSKVKVVDASWYMPAEKIDAYEYVFI